MDTYMYTFTTINNWTEYESSYENDYESDYEDYEDDFDPAAYKSAINTAMVDFGLLQLIPTPVALRNQLEFKHPTVPVARKSTFDYASVHPNHRPSLARAIKALWNDDELRRPAYVEMSYSREGGFACPLKRTDYSSNWLRIKKAMGFDMKLPAMIRRSPLQQSMTWEEDSEGDYIRESGFSFQPTCPPPLCYDSHSDEEQDDSQTPVGSPLIVSFYEKKGQFDEHNTDTAAIDIISNNQDAEVKASSEFADFNHISDSLDINDILGFSKHSTQHKYTNKTTICDNSIPPYEIDDAMQPMEPFWEKEITATGGIRHNQVNGRALEETRKPTSCTSPGVTLSCTPSDSLSIVNVRIDKEPTVPPIALNDNHTHRTPVVDLIAGDKIVRNVTKVPRTLPCAAPPVGDKTVGTQNNALNLIEFVEKAQATVELDTTMAEATHFIVPVAGYNMEAGVEEHSRSQSHSNRARAPTGLTSLVEVNDLSLDLVYVKNRASASVVRNIPSEGRFTLPSLPWGRITVTAVGALVDLIGSVIRR